MAIYHFSVKVISRANGSSALASAAYRSASRLHDERLDRDHDFTLKTGVVHSEVMLPDSAPESLSDRERLWNAVEAGEKRKDAQLSREVEFAIPREMTQVDGVSLARDFVQREMVDRGMIADLNVHWDIGTDGSPKPHAHVMLTMREVGQGGDDEPAFGAKVREWNATSLVERWREAWADHVNERLASLDIDASIDHRSLEAQGIDLEPQNKIGPAAARDKGLQFFVEVAPEARTWIYGDAVRLKQILTNLVSNAVKFTASGFVSLTVDAGPQGLRFVVQDTGIGFDAETRDRLFSRFEQADGNITRRFGGSGLGLAISRELAAMMGGGLGCESEPGGGAAFILTLPLRPAEKPAAPTPTVVTSEDSVFVENARRLRILVADDHPTNRRVVELILDQEAVDLVSVEDGAQAVEACRAAPFDLVLMDMQMPVMDGLTATREIRLHEVAMGAPRTPVVMLTANALPEHIAAGLDAGADRHLAKPFSVEALLAMVQELTTDAPQAAVQAA